MFTPCLQTCLHHVYLHVYTMFKPCLKTCFNQTWRFVYTLLEDMFAIFKQTSLNHVWRYVYIYAYTMLEHMFPPYLKISFHNAGGHVCNILGDESLPLNILWLFLPLNILCHDILKMLITSFPNILILKINLRCA